MDGKKYDKSTSKKMGVNESSPTYKLPSRTLRRHIIKGCKKQAENTENSIQNNDFPLPSTSKSLMNQNYQISEAPVISQAQITAKSLQEERRLPVIHHKLSKRKQNIITLKPENHFVTNKLFEEK